MAILIPDIKTNNWQISTAGFGMIAEGLADIRQCLDILLRTSKGSDPLRPEFGSDIFQYTDKPINTAIPNVVRAIIEAVQVWEQRVTVKKINWEISSTSTAKFFVTYQLVDEELIDMIVVNLNGGYVQYDIINPNPATLTLYALFPANTSNKRYKISFTANGTAVTPEQPPAGFETTAEMYNWVSANWGGYGTWQLAADRIILLAGPTITEGALTITLTGTLRFQSAIPIQGLGQSLALSFIPEGTPGTYPVLEYATMGEMLLWLQSNYSHFGTWEIEGNIDYPKDFASGDFNADDFDVGIPSMYFLVLYSDVLNSCFLEVNIA